MICISLHILGQQMPDGTLYIIGAGVVAAVALLVFFLGQMADLLSRLVSVFGWTSDSRFVGGLARWAKRRRIQHHLEILRTLGIDDVAQVELRRAGIEINAKRSRRATAVSRPDVELLHALKPWVCQLTAPYSYPETQDYYIDSMGAVHYGSPEAEPLTNILTEWTRLLIKHDHVRPFDCVITNKLGNVEIAQAVCARLSLRPRPEAIRWKPEKFDNSRVARNLDSPPHPSDFEGLSAFLDRNRDDIANGKRYRAIGLDDNVTGGTSLTAAISAFNELVNAHTLPFECVDTAVVLFRVQKPPGEVIRMQEAQIRLHALLSLGRDEMERIRTGDVKRLARQIDRFKKGYGCEVSRALTTGGVK